MHFVGLCGAVLGSSLLSCPFARLSELGWVALASEIDGGPEVWGLGGFLLGLLVVLRLWPWCLGCAGQRPSWT